MADKKFAGPDRRKQKRLTRAEENDLARRIQAGDETARTELITVNLPLVTYIVKRSFDIDAEHVDDAIGWGRLGLVIAADSFDGERGSFAAWARFKIMEQIRRWLEKEKMLLKIPRRMLTDLRTLGRVEAQLAKRLGCAPTREQLTTVLVAAPYTMKNDYIETMLEYRLVTALPMEQPIDESGTPLGDVIAAEEHVVEHLEEMDEQQRTIAMLMVIADLSDEDEFVLAAHYGLNGVRARSDAEIGRELVPQRRAEWVERQRERLLGRLRDAARTATQSEEDDGDA